jgi:MFS family permease
MASTISGVRTPAAPKIAIFTRFSPYDFQAALSCSSPWISVIGNQIDLSIILFYDAGKLGLVGNPCLSALLGVKIKREITRLKGTSLNNSRFPALAYRNFRIFWIGQFISLIGTWMQSTVQPYLAYRLTDQPIYLGLVGFAGALPSLLFTLPVGVMVERLDKRKTVIVAQFVMMVQAFILGILALTGRVTIWHIIGLAFIMGIANSVDMVARQSMLRELTDISVLPNAIALNSTIFNAARVLGPTLSAPFLVYLGNNGEGWAFLANAVSYLFVIIGLFMINTRSVIPPRVEGNSPLDDFKEGQRYISSSKIIPLIIILVAIPGIFGFPFSQQIPVFAKVGLHQVGDTEAIVAARNSLLMTAQGVGALFAALGLAVFSTFRKKGRLLASGQIVFAIALILLGFTHNTPLASVFFMIAGWGMVTQLALNNTLVQLNSPNELRGRVLSTYIWAMNGVSPFGSLLIGWLAQNWGIQVAVLIGGGICLASFIIGHALRPAIRETVL